MDFVADLLTEPSEPVFVTVKGDVSPSSQQHVELDIAKFRSGRWAMQLDAAFARREAPAVIVAQGVACLAVSWWAQLSPRSYLHRIGGAVFRAPLSIGVGQLATAAAVRSGPTYRLPFPSIVLNDASFRMAETLSLADKWGSRFVVGAGPQPGRPSNQHNNGADARDFLLAYLPLLERVSPGETVPPTDAFAHQPGTQG
ncbi:alpha/beta hydrolase [Sphingomonas sp.]|jgi:hypothetical protein|uniref:alpha/beta hydrolase n=1 Tax=Sphingomonas sp. TaxID=28214 RepID=UPI0035C80A1E